MAAPLLKNAPFTIHDGDLSDDFSSSASPEEQPISPGQYDDHDKRKFDQVDSNGRSPASKHTRKAFDLNNKRALINTLLTRLSTLCRYRRLPRQLRW
jgi:hypothetical protein